MKLFKSLLKKKNETSFPKEVNSWEKVAKYHRDLAKKHTTLSHEYGDEGNYKAEDLHDKAAKAHRLAHEALHYPDDKKGYDELSKNAENASKKANFFVKESLDESNTSNYHLTQYRKHANIAVKEYDNDRDLSDLHLKAANAHKLAYSAYHKLDDGDEKGDYNTFSKYAELASKAANTSSKDNSSIKESLDESRSPYRTQFDAWNKTGADNTFSNNKNIEIKTLKKPLLLSNVLTHGKSFSSNPEHKDHGIPHVKLFDRRYHSFNDELDRNVGTHIEYDVKLPKYSKIIIDKKHNHLYGAHPKHGFIRADYYEDDHKNLTESNESLDIATVFKNIASKYKDKQTKSTESRSAPDTGKFIAKHCGHIEYLPNVQTYRGHGGMFVDDHDHFIQVGSNVDHETRKNIYKDVHNTLKDHGYKSVDYKGNETNDLDNINKDWIKLKDKNGNKHILSKVGGSAWGGIGLMHNK